MTSPAIGFDFESPPWSWALLIETKAAHQVAWAAFTSLTVIVSAMTAGLAWLDGADSARAVADIASAEANRSSMK